MEPATPQPDRQLLAHRITLCIICLGCHVVIEVQRSRARIADLASRPAYQRTLCPHCRRPWSWHSLSHIHEVSEAWHALSDAARYSMSVPMAVDGAPRGRGSHR